MQQPASLRLLVPGSVGYNKPNDSLTTGSRCISRAIKCKRLWFYERSSLLRFMSIAATSNTSWKFTVVITGEPGAPVKLGLNKYRLIKELDEAIAKAEERRGY